MEDNNLPKYEDVVKHTSNSKNFQLFALEFPECVFLRSLKIFGG